MSSFLIGLFLGVAIGVVVMALMAAGKDEDR